MTNKFNFFLVILLSVISSLLITGCKDDPDDPEIESYPSIILSSAETSNYPGNTVSTSVSITAPNGLKKMTILKEGSLYEEVNYNSEKTANYSFSYTIEAGLTAGSIVNFAFIAIDSLGKQSDQVLFKINILELITREIVQVNGDITENSIWTSDKIWRLNNIVKVTDGVTLTIEPGTIIKGASESNGTLLIQRGGKIMAQGTASNPIVFTSDKDPGSREAGDWGGIVICGKAPNNQGASIILEGDYGAVHGGTNPQDNSGTLSYIRIEFAGHIINNNQEINSLTLASVGSSTNINNIQCSFGLDDSFEFFGGTVNAKNLISFKAKDDDIDTDFGHVGHIQFAVAVRDGNIADQFYSNGIEIDNDGAGTPMLPLTQTVLSNITIIGAKYIAEGIISPLLQNAAQFRRNSMPSIYNSFLTGFPVGIFIDDTKPGCSQNALEEKLQVRNTILAGVENWGNNNWGGSTNNTNVPLKQVNANVAPGFEVNTWFNTSNYNNQVLAKWQDAGIDQSVFNSVNPKFTPNSGSILLNSARWDNTPNAEDPFFDEVNYVGAFGPTDWTSGWSNWVPQTTIYQ